MMNFVQQQMEEYGHFPIHKKLSNGISFSGYGRNKIAILSSAQVHKFHNGEILEIDENWEGANGIFGNQLLNGRIKNNIISFADEKLTYSVNGVGTLKESTLEYSEIEKLKSTGGLSTGKREYVSDSVSGKYICSVMLHSDDAIKINLMILEKPANLSDDLFVIEINVASKNFEIPHGKIDYNLVYGNEIVFKQGYAWDNSNYENPHQNSVIKVTEYYDSNTKKMYIGVPVNWLDNAEFPVIIDPTTTLQGSGVTIDSYVDAVNNIDNYGSSTDLWLNRQNDQQRHYYIRYTLTSITDYFSINTATHNAYVNYTQMSTTCTTTLYATKRNWTESGISWDLYNGSSSWETDPGTGTNDRYANVSGEGLSSQSATVGTWWTYNCHTTVDLWLTGTYSNYGFFVTGTSAESTSGTRFDSSEGITSTQRPKLIIDYNAPPPSGVIATFFD